MNSVSPAASPEARTHESTEQGRRPIRRALISVYDKTGLEDLATALHDQGVALVSTGSTAGVIREAGVPVTPVEEVTGFAECLDGRVKTLHPAVHAGLLADTTNAEHLDSINSLGIEAFDLLVVNLYPFSQTVAAGTDRDGCIEQIDIGGPAMVRAAAKNHRSVAVVVDPAAYGGLVEAVGQGGLTLSARQHLAGTAFGHTATYDTAVAAWMAGEFSAPASDAGPADSSMPEPADARFPEVASAAWVVHDVLRYGENPHQQAAVYRVRSGGPLGDDAGVAGADQLHGKAMSYNNYVDADAALRAAYEQDDRPCVAIIKHANPCGIAIGQEIAEAHARAHACDPVSAYGGVVAANREVSESMAHALAEIFTEVVIAPSFAPKALTLLQAKKNVRLLKVTPRSGVPAIEGRLITGGLLLQRRDDLDAVADGGGDDPHLWQHVAGPSASAERVADLEFAWRACRSAKSNAILLASDGASVGIGMGQVNRVDSCRLAVARAGDRAAGSVAASDAFFPFADGVQVLLEAGVVGVVAPGGSIRDDEVIAAAQAAGVSLYFTGTRHFAH
ncbi:MAG: bifunctional phosphoribosylaminoimidazolecarboxamide formyltransferase/IMP cyclohydrolase [Ornithinimicrobium sp.]